LPLARKEESRNQREAENEHGVFVFKADARDGAEREPPFRRSPFGDSYCDPRTERPDERLECVHGKKGVEGEIGRGQQNCGGRQKHSESLSAKILRDNASEENNRCSGQCRQQSDGEQRTSENVPREPCNESDKRRLVNVAPCQVFTAS